MRTTFLLVVSLLLISCKTTDRITKDIDAIDKQQKWGLLYMREVIIKGRLMN